MNPLPLVLATLRRHRFTFALFTTLVAIAVALGVAISSAERALRQGSARAADKFDLVVAAPGSRNDVVFTAIYLKPGTVPLLDAAMVAKALAEPRARIAAPVAFGDSHHGAPVVGTVAAFVDHLSGGLAAGREFAAVNEAVVGANSPLQIGETFRPAHGDGHAADADADEDEGHEHPIDIKVVGRMKPTGTPWDKAIAVPVEQVWSVHGLPYGHQPVAEGQPIPVGPPFEAAYVSGAPAVILTPENVNAAYGLRSLYKTNASMAFFPAEVLVDIYAVMGDVRTLLATVAWSAQVLVALAILAALAALFALNRRQFAVLRALGAPPAFFMAGTWAYVALIIVAGSVIGMGLGVGAAALLAANVSRQTGVALNASVGLPELWLVLAFVAAGLVLALVPAWLSSRGSAMEALTGA